jgi:hypothetical protein
MCIYYILNVVNLLHVSVTFVTFFREVFFEGYITRTTKPIYFLFYILIYIVNHVFKTDYFIIGLFVFVFVIYPLSKNLPEDDHRR